MRRRCWRGRAARTASSGRPGASRTLDRAAPFAELMARESLAPAIDCLVPFAHWITPAFLPKRFDTHFFLALAPADQALAHDGREAVDSVWISPREALAEHGRRFKLLFPTERNLWKLAAHADAASALAAARVDAGRDRAARKGRGRRRPGLKNPGRGRLRRRSLFGSRAALSSQRAKAAVIGLKGPGGSTSDG